MKIDTYIPKFKPDDKVLFYCQGKNRLVLASIEYCLYDRHNKTWAYSLKGWCATFKEEDISAFNLIGDGLNFTYED